jgi:hypothetical protein
MLWLCVKKQKGWRWSIAEGEDKELSQAPLPRGSKHGCDRPHHTRDILMGGLNNYMGCMAKHAIRMHCPIRVRVGYLQGACECDQENTQGAEQETPATRVPTSIAAGQVHKITISR